MPLITMMAMIIMTFMTNDASDVNCAVVDDVDVVMLMVLKMPMSVMKNTMTQFESWVCQIQKYRSKPKQQSDDERAGLSILE